MMGDVLLGIVSLCTLISYLPQAIKLIKTKQSNDLSTTSWIIWDLHLGKINQTDQFIGMMLM